MNRVDKIMLAVSNALRPKNLTKPLTPLINPMMEFEVGSTGTQIFGGYISEEYLADATGREWAEKVDMIRRSDPTVSMTLRALKLPIKSANWYVEIDKGTDMSDPLIAPIADRQKRIIEKALFTDCKKSFTRLLGEILTFNEFGFSLFEPTFKAKFYDKEIGTYNTLRNIAFRSQKTIEKWNVDSEGNLLTVTQMSYGDTGKLVDIPAEKLMHFSPEMEGDNFEGISLLRPMYGSWMRKNQYLKYIASGNEKSAIPTPLLQIPQSKTADESEKRAAKKMLKEYTSNSANYLMYPEGWKLDQFKLDFDPEKMMKCITYEDQQIVNSVLASFLLLGQGGNGGSYSLGKDLSGFFGQTFQCTTDYISEVIQKHIIKTLIAMNFGDEPCYVSLKCESLKDDADETFATVLKTFIDSKVIKPDSPLEKFIREKYQYPEADESTAREIEAQPSGDVIPFKFAESKAKSVPQLIRSTASELRDIFSSQVYALGVDYINEVMKVKNQTSDSDILKVPNISELPAYKFYKDMVSFINIESAKTATEQVERQGVKLSEDSKFRLSTKAHQAKIEKLNKILSEIMALSQRYSLNADYMRTKSELAELRRQFSMVYYDYKQELPSWKSSKMRANIEAQVSTLIDTQMNDLKKKIDLQYQSSARSTDSMKQLQFDLLESKDKFAESGALASGADILASQVVNETRLQVSLDDPEVESYTFKAVDDDRTTPICLELNDWTFAPNDPALARYSPPLHYNCRSFLQINMRSYRNNPPISSGTFTPSPDAAKSISLSECGKKFLACTHN